MCVCSGTAPDPTYYVIRLNFVCRAILIFRGRFGRRPFCLVTLRCGWIFDDYSQVFKAIILVIMCHLAPQLRSLVDIIGAKSYCIYALAEKHIWIRCMLEFSLTV